MQVDYVGYKFSGTCKDSALVRIAVPAPAAVGAAPGSAQPTFALGYFPAGCLAFDPTLNKCPGSAAAASQGPYSCAAHEECCSGRCNCPPSVGGPTGSDAFEVPVLGAKLPSGAPLSQRIRPANYGSTVFKKVCCPA